MLCTYNGERFLKAQIQSLLQQTWPNFEIIVSDDGSTDGTKSILQKYETDSRFRITYQLENLGTIENFAFATKQASGEYLAFCDQDDIWLPEKIEKLYHAIGDSFLVYSDSILIDEAGQSLQKNLSQLRKMGEVTDTRGFIFSNVVWGHAMLVNKNLLPHVLPIPSGIPHDIWFAAKASSITGIKYVDEALTLYRQHAATVTTTIAQKTEARASTQRYKDFEDKLYWITLLKENETVFTSFYDELYKLFSQKNKGSFVWPLFFFLLKNEKLLFQFTNKNFLSRLIEIRKIARGESMH